MSESGGQSMAAPPSFTGEGRTVLVTSAGRKLPLLRAIEGQLRGVGPYQVLAGDASPTCLAAYAWPQFWNMPSLSESTPEELSARMERFGVSVILPTSDRDVSYFATHKALFESRGMHVFSGSAMSVELCRDKLAFSRCLEEAGLPAIRTTTGPEVAHVSSQRFVVKERHGAGSMGLHVNITLQEVASAGSQLLDPIVQPFIEGVELSIDSYRATHGEVMGLVARTRDVVREGESQVTTVVDGGPYAELVSATLEAVGIHGHTVIQVILSEVGPQIVECNPRLGGASTLALSRGLHSVAWFALERNGTDPFSLPFQAPAVGTRLVRVPTDEIHDPGL